MAHGHGKWEWNGQGQRSRGTLLHFQIEAFLNMAIIEAGRSKINSRRPSPNDPRVRGECATLLDQFPARLVVVACGGGAVFVRRGRRRRSSANSCSSMRTTSQLRQAFSAVRYRSSTAACAWRARWTVSARASTAPSFCGIGRLYVCPVREGAAFPGPYPILGITARL